MLASFWSGYSSVLYEPDKFHKIVDNTVAKIKEIQKEIEFDAIAFTGTSGAALAYPIQYFTGIPLILVRKDGECSHGQRIESKNDMKIARYLILDDFTRTGNTINSIIKKIEEECSLRNYVQPAPVCVLFYRKSQFSGCDMKGFGETGIPVFLSEDE